MSIVDRCECLLFYAKDDVVQLYDRLQSDRTSQILMESTMNLWRLCSPIKTKKSIGVKRKETTVVIGIQKEKNDWRMLKSEEKEKREMERNEKGIRTELRKETKNTVRNTTSAFVVFADNARRTMNWIKWCWRENRSRLPGFVYTLTHKRTPVNAKRKHDSRVIQAHWQWLPWAFLINSQERSKDRLTWDAHEKILRHSERKVRIQKKKLAELQWLFSSWRTRTS